MSRKVRVFQQQGKAAVSSDSIHRRCQYPCTPCFRSKVRSRNWKIEVVQVIIDFLGFQSRMMNRMFRRSDSSTSIRSSSTNLPEIPQEDGTINSESFQLSDVDQKLGDWNIPKVPTTQVYKSSSWSLKKTFKTDYHVRTIEQIYNISKEYETCYLLSPAAVKAHREKHHKFLHIGLVQVGVKPLIREGLNNSILMAFRDIRLLRFDDSILGTMESSLSGRPVHFDCFPNLTVSLDNPHILKVLTLNIKTHGTLMLHGTRQLALIYRVYYMCMRTNMSIQAIDKRKAGETTLIQTPDVRSTVQVPRTLKWFEVTFLSHWTIDNENYQLQIQNPVRNPDLDFVHQLADGTIRLSFDQSRFRSPLEYDEPKPRSSVNLYEDQGLDSQIYANLLGSQLSNLEIDLHPSVVRLEHELPFPHLEETQVHSFKVSKTTPKLVPLVTQPNKTQLLIKKKTALVRTVLSLPHHQELI